MSTARLTTLYNAMVEADRIFSAAVADQFGAIRQGDMRYRSQHHSEATRSAGDAYVAACDAWREELRAVREQRNAPMPPVEPAHSARYEYIEKLTGLGMRWFCRLEGQQCWTGPFRTKVDAEHGARSL